MLHYKIGNILENVRTGTILHSVNTLGVMGAGVAKGIKDLYPKTYRQYQELCSEFDHTKLLGKYYTSTEINPEGSLDIINAFGQRNVGGTKPVSYDAIDSIFRELYSYEEDPIPELHTVKIGAGLGGGNWKVIEQIILEHLPNECNVYVWDFK